VTSVVCYVLVFVEFGQVIVVEQYIEPLGVLDRYPFVDGEFRPREPSGSPLRVP